MVTLQQDLGEEYAHVGFPKPLGDDRCGPTGEQEAGKRGVGLCPQSRHKNPPSELLTPKISFVL